MKRPRDISAEDLVRALRKLGYVQTRQSGSHLRLTTEQRGQHHITIPVHKHRNLTIGKITSIVWELVHHFGMSEREVLHLLFG